MAMSSPFAKAARMTARCTGVGGTGPPLNVLCQVGGTRKPYEHWKTARTLLQRE